MISDHPGLNETLQSAHAAIPSADDFEEDDREITAITALERETRKTEAALARLRDSVTTSPVLAASGPRTPPPIKTSTQDPRSTWVTRAIYNNSVFDVGIALTLRKAQVLPLDEAIANVVGRATDVARVNLMLIEGTLAITRGGSHYRTLKQHGQSVIFSRHTVDFGTVELEAVTRRTRFLVVAWRAEVDGA